MTHPPIFTVEEGRAWHDKIPGLHCKNLFLKDKRDKIWLAVIPGDNVGGLDRLENRAHAAWLSFGKPTLLMEVHCLTPVTVTPFGLHTAHEHRPSPLVDERM